MSKQVNSPSCHFEMGSKRAKWLFLQLYAFLGIYTILYSPMLALTGTGLTKVLVLCALAVAIPYASMRLKGTSTNQARCDSVVSSRDVRSSTFSYDGLELLRSMFLPLEPIAIFAKGGLRLIPNFSLLLFLFLIYGMFVFVLMQSLASFRGGDTAAFRLLVSLCTGIVPLSYFIVRAFPRSESAFIYLVRLTAVAGAIQSVLILLDSSSPLVRDVFSSIVLPPAGLSDSFRAAGLTSGTGDGLSFSQALCGICAFYLSLIASEWRKRMFWIGCFSLILASMMFVGRTGFVIMFAFIVFYSIFSGNRVRALDNLLASVISIALLIVVAVFVFDSERLTFMVETIVPYAFGEFYRLFEGQSLSTDSFSDLMANMLIFPANDWTWMIGDGYFGDPTNAEGNYQGTDIGYLRILFYVGLIGSLALYSWFVLAAYIVARALPNFEDKLFSAGVFFCFFIANMKFPFFFSALVIGFVGAMLFASHRDRSQCI